MDIFVSARVAGQMSPNPKSIVAWRGLSRSRRLLPWRFSPWSRQIRKAIPVAAEQVAGGFILPDYVGARPVLSTLRSATREGDLDRRAEPAFRRASSRTYGLSLPQIRNMSMKSSTEDKAEGTAKEAIGMVKEKTGEVIGNPDLEARGTAERVEGQVQKKVGDVKKFFDQ